MPRGKMLGGSSSMNFMIYVRGSKSDYNNWANHNSPGWDYESVLPYFKKSEGNLNAAYVAYQGGRYHNANGPVKIDNPLQNDFDIVFSDALKAAGVPFVDEFNANNETGYAYLQTLAYKGRRSSTAESFLAPAKERKNLHVIKNGYVTKILINDNNEAYGVEFEYKGKYKRKAFCRKEVIVSAGAIQSPPLLLRSGIGPRDHLEKCNISCKADLPVGFNLIDHVMVYLLFTFDVSTAPLSPLATFDNFYQYLVHKTGSFSAVTYLSAKLNTANKTKSPDIETYYTKIPRGAPEMNIKSFKYFWNMLQIDEMLLNKNKNHDLLLINLSLQQPKSRGRIKLDKYPSCDEPKIYPNFLGEAEDRAKILIAVKEQLTLMNSDPLRSLGTKFIHVPIPECDALSPNLMSDEYLECYIKYFSISGSHQMGTSKMGSGPDAVVDPKCRVRKVKQLRQIDAGM